MSCPGLVHRSCRTSQRLRRFAWEEWCDGERGPEGGLRPPSGPRSPSHHSSQGDGVAVRRKKATGIKKVRGTYNGHEEKPARYLN